MAPPDGCCCQPQRCGCATGRSPCVREDNTLPGARHSQEVKRLALGHARRSVPHSPTSFNASDGPKLWISVRSTPSAPYSAVLTSKVGRVDLLDPDAWLGQLSDRLCAFIVECREHDLELGVAVQHLRLVRRHRVTAIGSARRHVRAGPLPTRAARIVSRDEWHRTSR